MVLTKQDESFPGLLGLVNLYLNSLNMDVSTKCQLRKYLDLVKRRAKGKLFGPRCVIDQKVNCALRLHGFVTSS